MKIHLFIFTLLVMAFSVDAQTARTAKSEPKPPVAEAVKPDVRPTKKAVIEKINGDRMTGLFVSGDAESIIIEVDSTNLKVKFSDLKSLRIGDDSEPVAAAPSLPAPSPVPALAPVDFSAKPRVTATLEDAALFPDNYTNRTVDFKGVWIGDIDIVRDGADTAYTLFVESVKGKIFVNGVDPRNDINFILVGDIAKQLSDFYQVNRGKDRKIAANLQTNFIRTTAPNGLTYTIAGIKCVQTVAYNGKIVNSFGVCD